MTSPLLSSSPDSSRPPFILSWKDSSTSSKRVGRNEQRYREEEKPDELCMLGTKTMSRKQAPRGVELSSVVSAQPSLTVLALPHTGPFASLGLKILFCKTEAQP